MMLLTKKELAELLRCKESTIGNVVYSKQIPFLMAGREVRFLKDSILKWLAEREIQPTFDSTKKITQDYPVSIL